ncbi:nitric oxide synthase, inducible-like [Gigantopelta aegis]|uniref:nitric oxide synthase, inducible-like n=1 Tax=Gigantopelta aegis TaxID=1735272 RepID=UPI001B8887CD|nr:nitric oxide synthase, inducible-like [Gigantopelta aegis]
MGKEEETGNMALMDRPANGFVSTTRPDGKTTEVKTNSGKTTEEKTNCVKPKRLTKLKNLLDDKMFVDVLHKKCIEEVTCTPERCMGSQYAHMTKRPPGVPRPKEELIVHAKDFIDQYYQSIKKLNAPAHLERMEEVLSSIESTGTYDLTASELTFGVKTGWRNAPRCIGRIHWSKLQMFDARHVTTAKEMFDALCKQIIYATNNGKVRSSITIFPQRTDPREDYRFWNTHVIQYAGYRQPDGSVIGDPMNCEFTEVCIEMGWKAKGGMFDILPIVISARGHDPEMFEVPAELLLEVPLKHPKYPWFSELGYKWSSVPILTSFLFDCGGIEFTACPFNGWFMEAEIARDLCDPNRYNITETVAQMMGVDTQSPLSLWKDQAFLEVNIAVLHSYQDAGIYITDHHSVSDSFIKHLENEQRLRGGCPADWVWVVPPIGGSLTQVFHQEMIRYNLKPSYEYQVAPWKMGVDKDRGKSNRRNLHFKTVVKAVRFGIKLMNTVLTRRVKCLVLYATETGTSERFARTTCDIFKHAFRAKVMCMDEYDVTQLENEALVLIVSSTFGSGESPEQGMIFSKHLTTLRNEYERLRSGNDGPLGNVRFSVFALGSTAYLRCNFCAFGRFLDNVLHDLGAGRIIPVGEGDQLYGQEESFRNWAQDVFKTACDAFGLTETIDMAAAVGALVKADVIWSASTFRTTALEEKEMDVWTGLSKLHSKSIVPCKLVERIQLQSAESSRQTILVKLDNEGAVELLYQPGDHVGIYPTNSPDLVDAILARLDDAPPPTQVIQVELLQETIMPSGSIKTWKKTGKMPRCSLRTALRHYLDITTPPSQSFLKLLATQASRDDDREVLEQLSTVSQLYEDWKHEKTPNLLDVLDEFPSVKVPPSLIMTQLPFLQQRLYSISSSPLITPDQIHATIAVVEYGAPGRNSCTREGVCSGWLNSCQIGEIVPCTVRTESGFRMPDDMTLPIFAVSAGAGIAPFRSFWQQRKINKEMLLAKSADGKSWGEMNLFFGCRNPAEDFLFESELRQMKAESILTGGYIAFSRMQGKRKVYVQDILLQMSAAVYTGIVNRGGHLYVCGGTEMASDVNDALEKILQKEGGMSLDAAKKYIQDLQNDNRYHRDIFGAKVQRYLKTDVKLEKALKPKSSQKTATDPVNPAATNPGKTPETNSVKTPERYPVIRTEEYAVLTPQKYPVITPQRYPVKTPEANHSGQGSWGNPEEKPEETKRKNKKTSSRCSII